MEYERFTQELDVRIKSHPSFYLLFEFDALPQCTMCARKRTIQLEFYSGDVISHWIEISTENCRYNAIQVNLKCIWRERLQQTHTHTHTSFNEWIASLHTYWIIYLLFHIILYSFCRCIDVDRTNIHLQHHIAQCIDSKTRSNSM